MCTRNLDRLPCPTSVAVIGTSDQPGVVVALDARVRIEPAAAAGASRLAIRPYPKELEEHVEFDGRRILLRPIRPEDRPAHEAFLARYTQIDYRRQMAFVAVDAAGAGILGVARAHADPDNHAADFAILVRSDLKGRNLGEILLEKLIRYCRGRGTGRLVGQAYADNGRMLALAQNLGFHRGACRDGILELVLELQDAGGRAA